MSGRVPRRTRTATVLAFLGLLSCSPPTVEVAPWTSARAVTPLAVTISYRADPCRQVDHFEVGYEPEEIVVTMFMETQTYGRCLGLNVERRSTLELHERLRDRPVRDGARKI